MEEKRQFLHEILDLIMDINGFERRDRSLTGSEQPTAFFEFNGHVATVSIRVYDRGWMPYADADLDDDILLQGDSFDLETFVEELTRKKEELDV